MPPGGIVGYETGSHSIEKSGDSQKAPANAVQTRARGRAVCAASPDDAAQTRQTVQNARHDFHMSSMSANSTDVLPELDKLHRQSAAQIGGAVAGRDTSSTQAEPVSCEGILSATRFKQIAGPTRMMFFMGTSYKNLLAALEAFEKDVVNDNAGLTTSQKLDRIAEIRQQTNQFVNHNLAKLTKRADDQNYAGIVNNRLQAADALLLGLREASRPLYAELLGRDMSEAAFVPSNEVRSEDGFASGVQSTVDKITYKNGEIGVFKAGQNGGAVVHPGALASGIPANEKEANLSGREVATFRVDQLLELDLVPKTDFAIHNGKSGSTQLFVNGAELFRTEQLPVSGEEAAGITANLMSNHIMSGGIERYGFATDEIGAAELRKMEAKHLTGDDRLAFIGSLMEKNHLWATKDVCVDVGGIDFSSPSVQKSLADAHIHDLISGQVDRNGGNFVFEQADDGQVRAKLIDNNLSFGSNYNNLGKDGIDGLQSVESGVMLRELPRLIDAATAEKIEKLTQAALRDALAGTELKDAELDAAEQRLQALKVHIGNIRSGLVDGGRIVETWNDETFAEQMAANDNYVSRCLEELEAHVFDSPKRMEILLDDIASNGATSLMNIGARWDSEQWAVHLLRDLASGGEIFGALQRYEPETLGKLLLSFSPERLGDVLRARENSGQTATDAEARSAANIAQQLVDGNASVTDPNGKVFQQSRSEFMAWTLNALLGGQRLTADENNMA